MRMCRELLRDRDGKDGDVGDQQRQCEDRNHDAHRRCAVKKEITIVSAATTGAPQNSTSKLIPLGPRLGHCFSLQAVVLITDPSTTT
jgi:hypothetical protein